MLSWRIACTCRGDKLPTPTDLIDTVRDIVKDLGLTLVIEPGRSMVATSSAFVNTVTGEPAAADGTSQPGSWDSSAAQCSLKLLACQMHPFRPREPS